MACVESQQLSKPPRTDAEETEEIMVEVTVVGVPKTVSDLPDLLVWPNEFAGRAPHDNALLALMEGRIGRIGEQLGLPITNQANRDVGNM